MSTLQTVNGHCLYLGKVGEDLVVIFHDRDQVKTKFVEYEGNLYHADHTQGIVKLTPLSDDIILSPAVPRGKAHKLGTPMVIGDELQVIKPWRALAFTILQGIPFCFGLACWIKGPNKVWAWSLDQAN